MMIKLMHNLTFDLITPSKQSTNLSFLRSRYLLTQALFILDFASPSRKTFTDLNFKAQIWKFQFVHDSAYEGHVWLVNFSNGLALISYADKDVIISARIYTNNIVFNKEGISYLDARNGNRTESIFFVECLFGRLRRGDRW